MSMKKWVLGKVNGTAARTGRHEARRSAPSLHAGAPAQGTREPTIGRFAAGRAGREAGAHLGPYAPLIGAIREALEHFAASQLRLHLAIAERDRYVLTSIEVECEGSEDERALLRRFVTEFKPEQIKQYLARDVIAGLRNASAIDLSQFAGLNAIKDTTAAAGEEDIDPYEDLLADLRSGTPGAQASPYEVSLLGRWSQVEAPPGRAAARERPAGRTQAVHTPLAARALVLDIEDAAGPHRIELDAVVEGRRYVIGKDDGCDVVVDAVYASRRHCELWLDDGAWWVTDAGSTNGIRIESAHGALRVQSDRATPLELRAGEALVLSAHARGGTNQYARLTMPPVATLEPKAGAIATVAGTEVATPIAPPRVRQRGLTIAAHMRSGISEADLVERALPFFVGRSRNQALVIDGTYGDVSGRHLEIVALDESGASVVVHGDNGVRVAGRTYACGERFHWTAGQAMLLGRADEATSGCTLTLVRTA